MTLYSKIWVLERVSDPKSSFYTLSYIICENHASFRKLFVFHSMCPTMGATVDTNHSLGREPDDREALKIMLKGTHKTLANVLSRRGWIPSNPTLEFGSRNNRISQTDEASTLKLSETCEQT